MVSFLDLDCLTHMSLTIYFDDLFSGLVVSLDFVVCLTNMSVEVYVQGFFLVFVFLKTHMSLIINFPGFVLGLLCSLFKSYEFDSLFSEFCSLFYFCSFFNLYAFDTPF